MKTPGMIDGGSALRGGIDEICECFEMAWRSGKALSIEVAVQQANLAIDQIALLEELIAVEIDLRREQGASPRPEDYTSRFSISPSCIAKLCEGESVVEARDEDGVTGAPYSPQPSIGVEIPGFRILREIGRGGMAIVYKAHDIQLNRLVALKLIHQQPRISAFNQRQMQREAQSIAQLRHAGIVQIFGIGEHAGQPYLILELIDGLGLNEWLDDRPQSPGWAADLIARIARAVEHAHQQGVIHRDLKPANILLAPSAEARSMAVSSIQEPFGPDHPDASEDAAPFPVIADFGLAKQVFASDTISGPGALFGTPNYMPPEQSEGRSFEATSASDIYSLGAILYELLTGRPPLVGKTQLETLRLIGQAAPMPPRRRAPHIPPGLEAICLRCLEKSPENRYSSAEELSDELERCIQRSGLSRRRDSEAPRQAPRLRRMLAAGFSAVGDWLATLPQHDRDIRRAA
jgi:serine/threonine protein kinase